MGYCSLPKEAYVNEGWAIVRRDGHMAKKVVIIGGGAAGIDVLELLLRGHKCVEDIKITLLKREDEGFFSLCGLPFALQGMCGIEALSVFGPDFYINKGVDFRTSAEVKSINLEERYVHLDSEEQALHSAYSGNEPSGGLYTWQQNGWGKAGGCDCLQGIP
jgi:NADPH-dependent 2,4-dienoyl-CoA reductase/sulfur reductase-like enzyme